MFEDVVTGLARLDRDVSDAERVDQLTALERVKAACSAAQARVTVDLVRSQEQVAAEWRGRAQECADEADFDGWVAARDLARRATVAEDPAAERVDRERMSDRHRSGSRRRPRSDFGVAGQVALARRESPARGSRHLAMALALVGDLPRTMAALEAGAISEWRAELVVRGPPFFPPT